MKGCHWLEVVLFLVIAVLAFFVSASWASIVIGILALLLLVHRLSCKKCTCTCAVPEVKAVAKKPAARKKKK